LDVHLVTHLIHNPILKGVRVRNQNEQTRQQDRPAQVGVGAAQ
jgi:hypothetical protein